MTVQKITIAIDEVLLKRIDRLISENRFPNRSRAIQKAVREKLERIESSRLARELAKLDPFFEQKLANDDPVFSQEWLRD
jgi:metal-responsive CopG/Arc/MetJ family transcriptional regulator